MASTHLLRSPRLPQCALQPTCVRVLQAATMVFVVVSSGLGVSRDIMVILHRLVTHATKPVWQLVIARAIPVAILTMARAAVSLDHGVKTAGGAQVVTLVSCVIKHVSRRIIVLPIQPVILTMARATVSLDPGVKMDGGGRVVTLVSCVIKHVSRRIIVLPIQPVILTTARATVSLDPGVKMDGGARAVTLGISATNNVLPHITAQVHLHAMRLPVFVHL